MGYLASGYAFSVEPDWQRVRRLLPGFHVRGYKHRNRALWMLDAWKTIPGVNEHFPFTGAPIEFKDLKLESAEPDVPLATTFEQICDLVEASGQYLGYERALLRVPLAVAAAAKAPTFVFAADDDTLDFAALVEGGSYVKAGCRMEVLDMVLDGGLLRVMPLESDADDDDGTMSELLRGLAKIENVSLGEPTRVDGGRRIYHHPTTVWPDEWGSAEELLGFGTFDPFDTFAEQFEPVFEANPPKNGPVGQRAGRVVPRPAPSRDLGVLAAIAACFLWPFGIGLAIYHALRNEGRKAGQAGILRAAGLVLMIGGLTPLQIGLGPAASRDYEDLIYGGFAVVAAAVALGLRSCVDPEGPSSILRLWLVERGNPRRRITCIPIRTSNGDR